MRPAIMHNGDNYWEYLLLYTDDLLAISQNGSHLLCGKVGKYFELKEESIGPPKIYLGGKMREVILDNDSKAWAFGSSQYVLAAVANVEDYLKKSGAILPAKALTPTKNGY
ncbi:MAG TPA: hypothetical protein V6D48_22590 [Oculatellaceae cyanobacterium]